MHILQISHLLLQTGYRCIVDIVDNKKITEKQKIWNDKNVTFYQAEITIALPLVHILSCMHVYNQN